ncbi:MAG: sigma-70 family RNA polymerase sigma factor [Prevotella sp.]|nr:sigma-70 family RNA polymerase sigma factor [Prevotella sp.]
MIDFARLYDSHLDSLYAFGSRLTADSELLKDCIQDVFMKFYAKREELCLTVKNIEKYLYMSLRNRINDEYRRRARLTDDEITDLCLQPVAEADEFHRERMERQQALITNVEAVFPKLSPRQQQIITLYYVEQRKYDDICQIMGINYQSVRNLMHRSICRLREYASETV